MADVDEVVSRDRGLLWHPYAALDGPAPYAVRSAAGVRFQLSDADGRQFDVIDGMSSWWCAVHGYANPALDAAARAQLDTFSHVMFGGLTHEPAVVLAEKLISLAPAGLRHVFFADSGSVSVEVALKLAVQVQQAAGLTSRRRFLALRGAYHGDTTGAMSVCDPVDGMHSLFPDLVPTQLFLPRPPAAGLTDGRLSADPDPAAVEEWIADLERVVAAHEHELAGVIVEPVVQGAGGMWMYSPRCLRALREVTTAYGIPLIADEIATGFGRTGTMFACESAGVSPDIMCVGKALTGGYLSLAAVLCSEGIGRAITQSPQRALLHGPTFMANPLACAIAAASIDLVDASRLASVARIGSELHDQLQPARKLRAVRDVRVLGAIGVVELHENVDVVAVTRAALDAGVWLRPFRNLVYTMPPFISTSQDIGQIGAGILAAIRAV